MNNIPGNEHVAAVTSHARPGWFPLGSVESRAAARALADAKARSSRIQSEQVTGESRAPAVHTGRFLTSRISLLSFKFFRQNLSFSSRSRAT